MGYLSRIKKLYRKQIKETDKEARFLILISFTLTFIIARLTVYGIRYHFLPFSIFGDVYVSQVHIHHLVFGIILLLIAGLIRIPQFGEELMSFSSVIYGIGAALTLDEFALWLRLNPDAYFGRQGRISIDAVVIFSLVILSTVWFGHFWQKLFDNSLYYVYMFFKNKQWKHLSRLKRRSYVRAGVSLIIFSGLVSYLSGLAFGYYLFPSTHIHNSVKVKKASADTIIQSPLSRTDTKPAIFISTVSATVTIAPTSTLKPAGFCLQVPVLYYHHIDPASMAVGKNQTSLSVDNGLFDQQMAYLVSRDYTTITTEQLVNALKNHSSLTGKNIVLTFDDGYQDFYDYAFPVIQKYHLIANLAIPSGLLGVHVATNDYMSWDNLKSMVNSGLIHVDDHSWSHASMKAGTPDKDQFEIMTAKHQLEQALGKTMDIFVYPYGESKPEVWSLLANDGFLGAFSTTPGFTQCDSFIMNLHRNHVGNTSLASLGL